MTYDFAFERQYAIAERRDFEEEAMMRDFGARADRGFFGGGDPGDVPDGPDGPEDFCEHCGKGLSDEDGLMADDLSESICDACEALRTGRQASYAHLFIGRPQLERVCRNLGTAPRLDHLDSGVWLAVLHDLDGDYSYRIQTTGSEPAQAMDRLEKLLAEIDRC